MTENIQSITVGYAAEHLPKHALVIDFEAYQKLERKLSEAQTLLESAVGPGTDGGGSIIIALQLLRAAAENWDDSQASRNTGRAEAAWATVSEYIKQQQATVRASLLPQQQRARLATLETRIQKIRSIVDGRLDAHTCLDGALAGDIECSACGERDCPHNEPLHYHHDGCPACYFDEEKDS